MFWVLFGFENFGLLSVIDLPSLIASSFLIKI